MQQARAVQQCWPYFLPQELQLTTGERGCAASHVIAWQRCCAWRKPVLVFEVGPLGSSDIFQREISRGIGPF